MYSVIGRSAPRFGSVSGIKVTLQGQNHILTLSGNGSIVRIESEQTIIMRNLTLRGNNSNNASLAVYVGGNGTFTMESGEISGNTGSGVVSYGTFTMSGGEISGNTASSGGGGVYNSGTFTMSGGTISGNTASSGGGGVYNSGTVIMEGGEITGNTASSGGGMYVNSGTFRIVTGTIYGLDKEDGSANTATNGGSALSGGASYGRFINSGTEWYENGTLTASDTTVAVVNGILQSVGHAKVSATQFA